MSKPISASRGRFQTFLIHHTEKIVLSVVVIAVALLIFSGYSRKTPDGTHTSDKLILAAERAEKKIFDSDWTLVVADRQLEKTDFTERARQVQEAINQANFAFGPLRELERKPDQKRSDPQLLTLQDLEVRAGVGPFAHAHQGRDGRPGRAGPLGILAGAAGTDEEDPPRQLTNEEREAIEGYKPGGDVKAVGSYFAVLTGLVPVMQQQEEYDSCFLNADGYDPQRDRPRYVWYSVQRVEVTHDAAGEPDWKLLSTSRAIRGTRQWVSDGEEMADPRYVHVASIRGEASLTMPVPPLMMRNPDDYGFLHNQVPRVQLEYEEFDGTDEIEEPIEEPNDAPDAPGEIGDEGVDGLDGRIGAPGVPTRPHSNRPRGVRPPRGVGNIAGMPSGRFESPEQMIDHYLFRFIDLDVKPGKHYRYRVQLWIEDPNDPRNDAANVGRSEGRVGVERGTRGSGPPVRALNQEVVDRLNAKPEPKSGSPGEYYRKTDWSEPSRVVRVPMSHRLLAGQPTEVMIEKIRGTKVAYPRDEPRSTVLVIQWDEDKVMDVTAEKEVYRGSVVDFSTDTEALVPDTLEFLPLKDYQFKTGSMIVDMRGGQRLPGKDRNNPLLIPTEILVLDAEGNFSVHHELADYETYDKFHYEELPETTHPRGKFGGHEDPLYDGIFGPDRKNGQKKKKKLKKKP